MIGHSYRISLTNNAFVDGKPSPESKWAEKVSIRLGRALKQARQLRKDGNAFVMLWHVDDRTGAFRPVSLKPRSSKELNNEALASLTATRSSPRAQGHSAPYNMSALNDQGETLNDVMVDMIRHQAARGTSNG